MQYTIHSQGEFVAYGVEYVGYDEGNHIITFSRDGEVLHFPACNIRHGSGYISFDCDGVKHRAVVSN